MDDEELEELKERAAYYGLDKSDNFADFKTKYIRAVEVPQVDTPKVGVLNEPIDPWVSGDEHYLTVFDALKSKHVPYRPVKFIKNQENALDSITSIAGGDMTDGSCQSVALAYIARRNGWDVLDYRGGNSVKVLCRSRVLSDIAEMPGIKTIRPEFSNGTCGDIPCGIELLNRCEVGKEYYLCVGRHAAIVRKTDEIGGNGFQYLELQNGRDNGWVDFSSDPTDTLCYRFGCTRNEYASNTIAKLLRDTNFMIDIDSSDFDTPEFKSILGFLNTAGNKQKKGVSGYEK